MNHLWHPQRQPLVDGAMPADRRWLDAHPHMGNPHRLSIPQAQRLLLIDHSDTLTWPDRIATHFFFMREATL
jgi:hypothetical protein